MTSRDSVFVTSSSCLRDIVLSLRDLVIIQSESSFSLRDYVSLISLRDSVETRNKPDQEPALPLNQTCPHYNIDVLLFHIFIP